MVTPQQISPLRPVALALVLSASAIGSASAGPAEAWAIEQCEKLAKDVTAAIRMSVKASTGDPKSVSDLAPAGTACLLSGNAKGLAQSHAEAYERLQKVLEGWEQNPEIAADGPDSVLQGYRKGQREVVVELVRDPPAGTCKDVVQADCKVPAKRWLWTFRAAAYRK